MGCGASKEGNTVAQEKDDNHAAAAPAPVATEQKASAVAPVAVASPLAPAEREARTRDERKTSWDVIRGRLPRSKNPGDKARRVELWKRFDQNASGRLSLAEVDAACRDILHLDEFTSRLSNVLIRAFTETNGQGGKNGSADYVEFLEFRLLLCYIYDYFELQVMFDAVDSSDDGRVSREEFEKALPLVEKWGLKIADADATFKEVDVDNSGMILYSEFAAWASAKKLDADGDPDNDL